MIYSHSFITVLIESRKAKDLHERRWPLFEVNAMSVGHAGDAGGKAQGLRSAQQDGTTKRHDHKGPVCHIQQLAAQAHGPATWRSPSES